MPLALPELLLLAALIVALGICYSGKAFIDALIQLVNLTVGKLPIVGGWIGGKAGHALQAVSNRLGAYADGIGAQIARNFHFLATVVDRTGWAIFHTNVALERLFWHITVGYPLHVAFATVRDLARITKSLGHSSGAVNQTVRIVVKEVGHPGSTALGKAIRSAVAVAVRPLRAELRWERDKLLALEASIASAGDIAIPAPRIGVEGLKDALAKIKARLRKLENGAVPIIGVGAVAWALARLGMGALRCDNVTRTARRLCGMDAAILDSLLAGTVVIGSTLSVVTFAEACMAAEDEVVPLMKAGIRELKVL